MDGGAGGKDNYGKSEKNGGASPWLVVVTTGVGSPDLLLDFVQIRKQRKNEAKRRYTSAFLSRKQKKNGKKKLR